VQWVVTKGCCIARRQPPGGFGALVAAGLLESVRSVKVSVCVSTSAQVLEEAGWPPYSAFVCSGSEVRLGDSAAARTD